MASPDAGLLPATRIHEFSLLPEHPARIFLKRDDEAGFAISAGKKRKFASFISWLKQEGYVGALVIGGSNSNHVLAAAQLLPEQGLKATLFVKAAHAPAACGNAFLTNLLQAKADWHIIDGAKWPQVMQLAAIEQARLAKAGSRQFLLPEGAFVAEALPGALHLATDLLRNEAENGLKMRHIFVDAGTGLSAAALVLGLALAGHPAMVHIVSMAEPQAAMEVRIAQCYAWFDAMRGSPKDQLALRYRIYQPRNARAFGSVNRTLIRAIQRFAHNFGLLTEPIYSAKLILEAESLILEQNLTGDIVIIHSGGLQTLPGFAAKFNLEAHT